MSRLIRSPTRTISNRGPIPKFIGYYTLRKAGSDQVQFDSLSSVYVGVYLDWRADVEQVAFEAHRIDFEWEGRPARAFPDFHVAWTQGELGYAEAKFCPPPAGSAESLRLAHLGAHLRKQGYRYDVFFRTELEKGGFIQTIFLLRRYARLPIPNGVLDRAQALLLTGEPLTLAQHRMRAAALGVSTSVLYQLLYFQRLPLKYAYFQHPEMQLCHG